MISGNLEESLMVFEMMNPADPTTPLNHDNLILQGGVAK